ncbi:hypothetical protein V6N13_074413 [Hibiscus sabdariffa]|uniref:Uncharacterized protein n=1 Tax=Hibiscus sabdariffa TaxID=183260 RepID=A0ABR2U8P2_9ROSI
MKRCGISHNMLMPGPSPSLRKQNRDIVKLGQFKKESAPYKRIIIQRLGEIPNRPRHNQEMIMTHMLFPDLRLIGLQKLEQVQPMLEAGIHIRDIQIPQRITGSIVREKDDVGKIGVIFKTRVFKDSSMED